MFILGVFYALCVSMVGVLDYTLASLELDSKVAGLSDVGF